MTYFVSLFVCYDIRNSSKKYHFVADLHEVQQYLTVWLSRIQNPQSFLTWHLECIYGLTSDLWSREILQDIWVGIVWLNKNINCQSNISNMASSSRHMSNPAYASLLYLGAAKQKRHKGTQPLRSAHLYRSWDWMVYASFNVLDDLLEYLKPDHQSSFF